MINDQSFIDKSYELHENHFQAYKAGGERSSRAKTWMNFDTVDFWRHQRMYDSVLPILKVDSKSKWLTVGDGRYGRDAHILKRMGPNISVLATDISDSLLAEGKDLGIIEDYSKENCEKLSFDSDAFDYVFCKESYHHFPRPSLAVYEMLRVAKKGIVLIEPVDSKQVSNLRAFMFQRLKFYIKSLLGKKTQYHSFEESGNYVYSLSIREVEKMALGIGFRYIAVKGINDVYVEGVEDVSLSDNNLLFKSLKKKIARLDFLVKAGLQQSNILIAVIFKEEPSVALKNELNKSGFEVIGLPKNPYL